MDVCRYRFCFITLMFFFMMPLSEAKEFSLPAPVTSGIETGQGVFLGTHNGLVKLNGESILSLKDAGVDVGRVRVIQRVDNDSALVGGDGLWLVDFKTMTSTLLLNKQVKYFALAGDTLALHTDYVTSETFLFTLRNGALSLSTKVDVLGRLKDLFSVNSEIYALTDSGVKRLDGKRFSHFYDGNFKSVYANELNLVLAESNTIHVFSFSLGKWTQFQLPFIIQTIKGALQPDLAWIRSSDRWIKIGLANGQSLDFVMTTSPFVYEHKGGLITHLNGTLYAGKTSAHIDSDKKPLIPVGTIEPSFTVVGSKAFSTGKDGIYDLATGQLVKKVDSGDGVFQGSCPIFPFYAAA